LTQIIKNKNKKEKKRKHQSVCDLWNLWKSMEIYGHCNCGNYGNCGNLWKLWKSMEIYGATTQMWKSMKIYGNLWKSMVPQIGTLQNCGNLWQSVVICGNLWQSMAIYGHCNCGNYGNCGNL
jgi:hypothetical protein